MTSVVTMVSSPSEPADRTPPSLILSPIEQSDHTASSIPTGLTPNHENMYKRDKNEKCRSPDPVGETLMNIEEEQSKIAEELQLERKKTGMERLAKKERELKRDIEKDFPTTRPRSPTIADLSTVVPDAVLQCDRDKEKEAENELHVRNLIAQVVSCHNALNNHHFVNDQLYNEFELVVDDLKEELIEKKKGWKAAKYQLGETLTFREGMTEELIWEAFHNPFAAKTLLEIPFFIVSDYECGTIVVKWKGDIKEEMKIKNVKYFTKDVEQDGSPKNRCVQCFTDMGPNNPRQLCGKTNCDDDLREARNIQAVKHTTEKQREVKRKLEMSERTEEQYEIKRKTNIDTEKRIKTFSSHDVNRKTVVVPK